MAEQLKKAALYCRLSEEDRNKSRKEEDSQSIQNQKSMLLQYAFAQGWEIYDVYSDDDYAGADRRRPAFNRLLRDAREHRFDIILCKTQSRFTREVELVEKYIHGLFPLYFELRTVQNHRVFPAGPHVPLPAGHYADPAGAFREAV